MLAADLPHMFFECPELSAYWQKILSLLNQKLKSPIKLTALDVLLGGSSLSIEQKDLLSILLACARLTIARVWISRCPPTVVDWWGLVKDIYAMESKLAKGGGGDLLLN